MKMQSLYEKIRGLFHSVVYTLLPLVGGGWVAVSCSDFFEQESDYVIFTEKDHLNNATDTLYSVTGIINKLQALADRTILLGEVRGDLVDITSSASADLRDVALFNIGDDNTYNSPRDYYAVINNCNYFIANVDTALRNNRNEHIFMREYAAVKAFRAWTYLQLALVYGSVPFVTEPILTKEAADKDYARYDIQQVCNYFINDLQPLAEEYNNELPRYGTVRNTDSRFFYFPLYVLLGELNLWAGNYKEAALCYYNYISKRNGTNSYYAPSTNSVFWSSSTWNMPRDSWSLSCFMSENYSNQAELITMIPCDSIPSEGNYSQLRSLFNSREENDYKVSLTPSQSMFDISESQVYCYVTPTTHNVIYAPSGMDRHRSGDLRLSQVYTAMENVRLSGVDEPIDYQSIDKFYTRNVHIWRRTMIYQHLAEALNQAGYPRFAYEILAQGVNNRIIESEVVPYYAADSTWLRQFNFSNSYYYIASPDGLSSENTLGLHSRGSGSSDYNEYYQFPDSIMLADSTMQAVPLARQQEYVDSLLLNESALEFAFEGQRYYDLMRFALRAGKPSILADRVYARRGKEQAEAMKAEIQKDLYNTQNWYINWNGKIGF